ncbi:hypothetical protein ACFLU5_09655 [Bacteroidota bacterium]
MKQKSHILIKYLVIPVMFLSLLVIMDFLSTGTQKQETITDTECWLDLKVFTCNLAYTNTHTFSFIPVNQTLKNNQPINLLITPIFGKVKAFTIPDDGNNIHFSFTAIFCHLFLPIIILITGLFTIRSISKVKILFITGELILLISCLMFL